MPFATFPQEPMLRNKGGLCKLSRVELPSVRMKQWWIFHKEFKEGFKLATNC